MARLFGRGKKNSKVNTTTTVNLTPLEQICGSDREAYEALYHVMFLDPRKIDSSVKEAADKAKKAEKDKDPTSARMWYEVAGGLSIYEDNVKKVAEYFGEAARVTGQKYPIVNNPAKAVAKAQEYYKKYLPP